MQQDIGPVLVSVCGLLCVGGGLVAVIAFLALKATGRTLFNAFDEIGGVAAALGISEASTADTDINAPARRPGGRRDLRARAESLDFDAAVSRHAASPPPAQAAPRPSAPNTGTPVYPASPTPGAAPLQPPSPFDEDSRPALRSRRFRRDRADDSDDDPDMLAGLMGEE